MDSFPPNYVLIFSRIHLISVITRGSVALNEKPFHYMPSSVNVYLRVNSFIKHVLSLIVDKLISSCFLMFNIWRQFDVTLEFCDFKTWYMNRHSVNGIFDATRLGNMHFLFLCIISFHFTHKLYRHQIDPLETPIPWTMRSAIVKIYFIWPKIVENGGKSSFFYLPLSTL